jgi:anti-sigma B factor antagonist
MVDSACKYTLAILPSSQDLKEEMRNVVLEYRPEALSDLESAVLSALEDGASQVVLDLDRLEALDTDGVRGLIRLLRSSRAAGGELALSSSKPSVRRTLSVTALDRLFPMVEAA